MRKASGKTHSGAQNNHVFMWCRWKYHQTKPNLIKSTSVYSQPLCHFVLCVFSKQYPYHMAPVLSLSVCPCLCNFKWIGWLGFYENSNKNSSIWEEGPVSSSWTIIGIIATYLQLKLVDRMIGGGGGNSIIVLYYQQGTNFVQSLKATLLCFSFCLSFCDKRKGRAITFLIACICIYFAYAVELLKSTNKAYDMRKKQRIGEGSPESSY